MNLNVLNDEQRRAVMTTEGQVLCLAGAGSGKTRMLTHRVAYLIDDCEVNPWNIMAITFTNKAAGEMRERVDKLVGFGAESIWVATFHSSCARILRRYIDRIGYDNNFSIYDTDDAKSVIKNICKKMELDPKIYKERALLSAISSAKNEGIGAAEYRLSAGGDFRLQKTAQVYEEYERVMKKNNALDFDDLLLKTVELLKTDAEVLASYRNRFRYIMVDEYQDTNSVQFEFVRQLAGTNGNLCVVGDDDQSIYRFRGANIFNILNFEKYYPGAAVIKLEQNYRSTSCILDAANGVIRNNRGRKDKTLWCERGQGEKLHFKQFDTAYEEAVFVADDIRRTRREKPGAGEAAVLYRTNAQSRILEEQFVLKGIPYQVVGGLNFYARKEIKDILAYLRTIDNGRDDTAVKRIINLPRRGIGQATTDRVQEYADERQISFYEALLESEHIMTLSRSAAAKLEPFVKLIQSFRAKTEYYDLEKLVRDVIELSGYQDMLVDSDEEDSEDRLENLEELMSKVVTYAENTEDPTLTGFLEEVSLVSDREDAGAEENRVLLMTIHSAKGLEFERVYMTGMEDGLFPSYMTITADDISEMEEERRLAYVGITRAKDVLYLTCARSRMINGQTQYNAVSRFVREIPGQLLDQKIPHIKRHDEDFMADSAALNTEAVYTRPKAVLKPVRTPEENRPFHTRYQAGLEQLRKGSDMAAMPEYRTGDRVKHVKYGTGTVAAMEPGPKDVKVTVDFDSAGRKIMYAAFAKLIKV